MSARSNKLLILDVAALGWETVAGIPEADRADLPFRPMETVFPALTCTVQASFRTKALPCFHGLLANGFFDRTLARAFFWEQSAGLVYGRRVWREWRAGGRTVGLMFWQQSLGEEADLVLTPKPVHKHHGGVIPDCYSQPPDLYARLSRAIGRPFALKRYWGPMASRHSSEWIADATIEILRSSDAPDLLLAYLPHLDYEFQRSGPQSPPAREAIDLAFGLLRRIRAAAAEAGYEVLFFGDYAIVPVTRPPVFLNRRFREDGLFRVRTVAGMAYPDFAASRAFALADHEIALVYARDADSARRARRAVEELDGVRQALDSEGQRRLGTDSSPGGPDLIAIAEEGGWCAYPWWEDPEEAPDFADHVDIHNKPGYDPCELFRGWPPGRTRLDPGCVRGTHGRAGAGRRIAWMSSVPFDPPPANLVELAAAVEQWLNRQELP